MKSEGQKRVEKLLKCLFPLQVIRTEYFIRFDDGTRLFVDFYLPWFKIALEIDGAQHNSYNSFFYSSKSAFREQIVRDDKKNIWALKNNIVLIRMSDKEAKDITKEELFEIIKNAR